MNPMNEASALVMSQANPDALRQLGTTFRVDALGQGDPSLGFNLLATMAVVIADLAPTDGTVTTKEGKTARLGVNLLVTGSASTGLILDEVITEVGLRQSNFRRHLQSYVSWIEAQRAKPGATLPPMGPKSNGAEDTFVETQQDFGAYDKTTLEAWGRILREAPAEQTQHLFLQSRFLVSAAKAGDLDAQLKRLRPGNPLIHAGCASPKDLIDLGGLAAAIIEGRCPVSDSGEAARGHFLLTDPFRILQMAAKEPDEGTAWLQHFVWLCDGNAGPHASTTGKSPELPETITNRFRLALDVVLATRMNLQRKEPFQIELDTREAKIRFRAFLAGMEPRLPGISIAARNLIDSLAFGLCQLVRSGDPLVLSVASVEALAHFLVARMVNARTEMMHSGAVLRRRSQIQRIYLKLQQGPADARNIYRNLSLPAGECDECLRWMELVGLVRRENRKWELVEGARLRFEDHTVPLLEV